ncbi:MAG: DUF4339 domain-containing protein [Proteobacteria bacterium]|nr:DUF4339 domain-containing protein [Pseudomonadota bacterium]
MRGGADSPSAAKIEIACGDCGARYLVPMARVRGRVFRFTCRRCEQLVVARCDAGAVTMLPQSALSTAAAAEAGADPDDQTDYAEPQIDGTGADGSETDGSGADATEAWYVMLGEAPHGPLGLSALVALVHEHQLDGDAQIWSPSGSGWQRLAALPVLVERLGEGFGEVLGESQSTRFYQTADRSVSTVSDGATAYWRADLGQALPTRPPSTVELSAASASAAARPLTHTIELAENDAALSGVVSRGRSSTSAVERAGTVPDQPATSAVDPLQVTHAYEPEAEGTRLPINAPRRSAADSQPGNLDSASYRLAQAVESAREWSREIDPRWGVSPGRVGTLRGSLAQAHLRGAAGAADRASDPHTDRRGWSAVRAKRPQPVDDDAPVSGHGATIERRPADDALGPARASGPSAAPREAALGWEGDTADDAARFDDFARGFPPDHGIVASARLPTGYRGGVVAKVPAGGPSALALAPLYAPPLPPAGRVTLAPNLLLPLRPRFWSARRTAVTVASALALLLGVGGLTLAYLLTRAPAPDTPPALGSATPPARRSEAPLAPAAAPSPPAADASAHQAARSEERPKPAAAAAVVGAGPTQTPVLPKPSAAGRTQAPARARPAPARRRAARPQRQSARAAPRPSRTSARPESASAALSPELDIGLPPAAPRRRAGESTRRVDVDELLSVGAGATSGRADPARNDPARDDPAPRTARTTRASGDDDDAGELPRTLKKAQVAAVMRQLRTRVQRCLDQHHQPGRLGLRVAIQPYGRASGEVVGALAGTATAGCAERALTTVSFPRFSGEVIRFSYAFDLQ